MAQQGNDPGTGTRFNTETRLINPDGSYNVKRTGGLSAFRDIYHYLVNISWARFNLVVILAFLLINILFATLYLVIDSDCLGGVDYGDGWLDYYMTCFYFSVETMTTVGYGHIYPACHSIQLVSSVEALFGLMSFALMTGVLYGRFSKPTARLVFSKNFLISPFKEGKAVMLRFASQRDSVLLHVQATVLFACNKPNEHGEMVRTYFRVPLQFDNIQAMPLSWTLVHPIDENSPFWNKTPEEMRLEQMELLVQIKAFDETYHADVHGRYSYTIPDMVDNARFTKTFGTAPDGTVVLDLYSIGKYEKLD